MKTNTGINIRHLIITAALALGALNLASGCALFGEKEAPSPASIQPAGKVAKADLPALAKITLPQAAAAALAAVPGSVLKSELKIEDGGLIYAFQIVTPDKKLKEVMIDAGNGKVIPDGDND